MTQVIWQGTADVDGYDHPMRLVEDNEGRLMTEWASNTEDKDGNRVFDEREWYADYQVAFRDMEPSPAAELVNRMKADGLVG
jgi:hypothetical protein